MNVVWLFFICMYNAVNPLSKWRRKTDFTMLLHKLLRFCCNFLDLTFLFMQPNFADY